jgi:hypothetical protein
LGGDPKRGGRGGTKKVAGYMFFNSQLPDYGILGGKMPVCQFLAKKIIGFIWQGVL